MHLSVRDLLEATAFIAAICAITSIPKNGLALCAVFLHAGAFLPPLIMGFTAVLACKQNGTQLDFPKTGIVQFILRFCGYCGISVALLWSFFLLAWLFIFFRWLLAI